MFGIGLMELVVIAVFGVLVMGPERVPDLARQAAGLLKSAKKATDSVRDELRDNLGPDYADLELTDLHPRTLVRKHVLDAMHDDRDDLDDDADLIHLDDPDDLDEADQHDEDEDAARADDRSPVNDLIERHVS